MKQVTSDQVRHFANKTIVEPARKRGQQQITIRAGDVHIAMKLRDRMPLVCSALQAMKFQTSSRLRLLNQVGPHQGANRTLTFEIAALKPS